MTALALLFALCSPVSASPRLLVVVSVDQMRAEFLERGVPGGGLERLRKGAVFVNARHGHAGTETCPGHAAILTGRHPREHGIVANEWWDRASGREVYCVEDPLFGRSPRQLDSYTLGDALKAERPRAKVVSVSVKDRAAIALGGQRPDYALWFDKKAGVFTTSGYYARPGWLDRVNADLRRKGGPLAGTTDYARLSESPVGDELVLRAAFAALKREKLGRDSDTDILAVSFSATDYVGHRHGGDGPEMDAQLASLDKNLARLLDELDDRVGAGNWSLALTADHGSMPLAESERGRALKLRGVDYGELGARLEKTLQYQYPVKVRWVEYFNFPHVWLSTAALAASGLDRGQAIRQAAKILAQAEDVAAVYVPGDPSSDAYAEQHARAEHRVRAGDLLVRLKDDVSLAPRGWASHGSVHDLDARVPLVFLGAGVSAGRFEREARVVDLAPTLAALLGVRFPGGRDARVLEAALGK